MSKEYPLLYVGSFMALAPDQGYRNDYYGTSYSAILDSVVRVRTPGRL